MHKYFLKKLIYEDTLRYVDSCRHAMKKRSAVNTLCDLKMLYLQPFILKFPTPTPNRLLNYVVSTMYGKQHQFQWLHISVSFLNFVAFKSDSYRGQFLR
jgi:hypothetical protein